MAEMRTSKSFEFTGPGKLAQELFSCAGSPKVCPDFDKPGEYWFLVHLSFEPQGGGKGFELDQWARMGSSNMAAAKAVGKTLAQRAVSKGVKDVVFDRGGYLYHGRVKALADAAREGGLKF